MVLVHSYEAEDIIVSLSGEVDKKKAFFETFEAGF